MGPTTKLLHAYDQPFQKELWVLIFGGFQLMCALTTQSPTDWKRESKLEDQNLQNSVLETLIMPILKNVKQTLDISVLI